MNSARDLVNQSVSNRSHAATQRSETSVLPILTHLIAGAEALGTDDADLAQLVRQVQEFEPTNCRSLSRHLHDCGLREGRHSDFVVKAFDTNYNLHRLVLIRSPFFASAISGPWLESETREMTLYPEDIDINITKNGFEIALSCLYGNAATFIGIADAIEILATATWLGIPELVDQSVDTIHNFMNLEYAGRIIKMVTLNYYGDTSRRLLRVAENKLCQGGFNMPISWWNDVPACTIRRLLGLDWFYAPCEFDRFMLAKQLLDQRIRAVTNQNFSISQLLASNEFVSTLNSNVYKENDQTSESCNYTEVAHLLSLIRQEIFYMNMDFHQLQIVNSARTCCGTLIVPRELIAHAMCMKMKLRQRITTASPLQTILRLAIPCHYTYLNSTDDPNVSVPVWQATINTAANERAVRQLEPRLGQFISIKSFIFLFDDATAPWVPGGASVLRHFVRYRRGAERAQLNDDSRFTAAVIERMEALKRYPPFRFAVEFKNPVALMTGKRVHSKTFFYAGSLWNLYLVRVRNPGVPHRPFGLYLQRKPAQHNERHANQNRESHPQATEHVVQERIRFLESELESICRQPRPPADFEHSRQEQPNVSRRVEVESDDTSMMPMGHQEQTTVLWDCNPSDPSSCSFTSWLLPDQSPEEMRFMSQQSLEEIRFSSSDDHGDPTESMRLDGTCDHPALHDYSDCRQELMASFQVTTPVEGGSRFLMYDSRPSTFNLWDRPGWQSIYLGLIENMSFEAAVERGILGGQYGTDTIPRHQRHASTIGSQGHDSAEDDTSSGNPGDVWHDDSLESRTKLSEVTGDEEASLRFNVILNIL